MATFAMMAGNVVKNIIMAENKEAVEGVLDCVLIEYTKDNPAGIGWTYDPESRRFSPPAQQEEVIDLGMTDIWEYDSETGTYISPDQSS